MNTGCLILENEVLNLKSSNTLDRMSQTEASTACVVYNGCPENRIDAARVQTYLGDNSCLIVNDWYDADLILFKGCGGSIEKTSHSLNILEEIQREKV